MPYTGLIKPRATPLPRPTFDRPVRWLVPLIYLISALAFLFDLQHDNTLAYGIIYSPLVATAVFHKGRSGLWILTALASLLVVVGIFMPGVNPDMENLIGNRIISFVAIGATAAFVHHARNTQDRLAAATHRAEAAERMKTDILQTLSEEIRNPLHSLLGLMTLTMATSTPVQREVLTQVRGDARQLLATIDSLIGLSDLGERGLQLDSVDLSSLVGEAVASATAIARERQITVAAFYEDETKETSAIGDAAAIRRILDNFLSDALRAARPGETVAVTVGRRGNTVTASVSDPGHGVSIGLVRQPAEQVSLDGTELMLSRRLAQAMKGSINAAHEAPNGTTVTLCLPAA